MKGLSKQQDELFGRVDEVLHYLWDPIGVNGVPQARDEYDSYVPHVFSLLIQGRDAKAVADHLRQVRIVNMGLESPEIRGNEDEIADVLIGWRDSVLGEDE